MLIKFLIIISVVLISSRTFTSMTLNYVKPSKMMPCPKELKHCLTLKEYAHEREVYFVNNTVFYFYPGTHRLNQSLRLKSMYNLSFQGLPTQYGVVYIML